MEALESNDAERRQAARMVRAIAQGVAVGVPLAFLLITILVRIDGQPWSTAIATAWLPGTLLGVFGGGFAGTARTMD